MISIKLLLIAPLLAGTFAPPSTASAAERDRLHQTTADETETLTLDITGMT